MLCLTLIFSCVGCSREIPVEDTEGNGTVSNNNAKSEDNEGMAPESEESTQESAEATDTVTATPTATPTEEAKSIEEILVPEEGAELTLWVGDTTYGEAIAAAFEKAYGVPVTVEQNGMGTMDKIVLSGATGADVFFEAHDKFTYGLNAGILLEMDPAAVEVMNHTLEEVGIKTVSNNGKVYGVPISLETCCLFYNKDIVGDTPASTLEQIMEEAKSYNDPAQNKFYLLFNVGDAYKCYPILSSAGYQVFGENGNDVDNPYFDTDEFEQGLDLVASLNEVMPITSTDLGNTSLLKTQFIEGKVAYEISGPWDLTDFNKAGLNYGVIALPTYNGTALKSFAGVQNAHVNIYTEYPNASQLLALFMASPEGASILYNVGNKIPTIKDASQVDGLSEDEFVKPFMEQFANSFPMPSATRISYFWTIGADILKAVFDGQLTPAEGRTQAISRWDSFIAAE